MNKIVASLLAIIMCSLAASAQVTELLTKFDAASRNERINIANNLFSNFLAQDEDPKLHYDNSINSEHLEGVVYYWAGDYYINMSQFDRAATSLNHALPIMRKHGKGDDLPDCLSLLGIAYLRLGDFKTAIQYQEECLALDRKTGDQELISSSLNNIAATCATAGTTQPAIKYIEEAVKIERTLNRPAKLAIRLGVASEIYAKAGLLENALSAAQEALNVESEKGDQSRVPVRKSQLGAVYKAMGKTTQAYDMLRDAEKGLRETKNNNSLAITLNLLGEIDLQQHNYAEAARHLRESADLSVATGNSNSELTARRMLCQALHNTDPNAAIAELERYAALKDSIYSTESAQSLALFNVKYENAEKQHDIEILEQQVKNVHLWLVILGVIIVGAIIVIVLIWRIARVRDAKNKTLIKANLLKDELLEIARSNSNNNDDTGEKIEQLAQEMGSMGAMPQVKITRREREVMVLCCQGLLAKEVAERLNISQRTVETHKTNLYKKLGINNTVELIRYAQAIGALEQKKPI